MLTKDTPLISQGDYSADDITNAFERYGNAPPNIGQRIVDAAMAIGLNSDFLACQIADESAWWTSAYAVQRNNPSGYGATDGNPDNAYTFASPYDGIRMTVAHWGSYILGGANPLTEMDSRKQYISPDHYGRVRTLGDTGSGVWASAPDYADAIINRYNELATVAGKKNGGDTPQGGSMIPDQQYSLPVRLDLANNGKSWINRPTNPDGRILAIVKHVTDGEDLDGALSWNRSGRNADGSPVQASAHFYIDKDGTTVQDVSLFNGAYANGLLDNPSLPSQFDEVVSKGWNPNDFTISIEHVGKPEDDDFPTDAQLTADARLTADLCDFFKIPVDEDHIIGHYRFDSVSRARCPGPHWDFSRDVRAVSSLLNGGNDDGNHGGSTNGGKAPGGDGQPNGGTGKMAGTVDASGSGGNGRVTRDEQGRVTFARYGTTGHGVGGGFLRHYHDGAIPAIDNALDINPVYGYPVTDEYTTTAATIRSGQPTTVQWFERARFEWVVDNAETGEGHVELGRVGLEAMESLPPALVPGNAWRG